MKKIARKKLKKEDTELLVASGFAGFLGSLCCVGPILLFMLGLISISTVLSIGKFTWLFLSLAIIFMFIAILFYLKQKKSCNIEGVKKNWKIIMISFIIVVIFLVLLKYNFAPYLAEIAYRR